MNDEHDNDNNRDEELVEITLDGIPPELLNQMRALCAALGLNFDEELTDIIRMTNHRIEGQFTLRGALTDQDHK
jgi:hypothetical protein